MPILLMALLALLVFVVIGAICFAAVLAESRQAERMARQQRSVTTREVLGKAEDVQLSHR